MPAGKSKSRDYESLAPRRGENGSGARGGGQSPLETLKPPKNLPPKPGHKIPETQNLKNPNYTVQKHETEVPGEAAKPEPAISEREVPAVEPPKTYAEEQKIRRKEKAAAKDSRLISADRWIARNGHSLTYAGLYIFSILALFRPYELIPGLGFLSATAFYFAAATLLVFIPTQLATEGSMTAFPTEVKCVLAMIFLALLTMPVGKDFANSWAEFNDIFIKAASMFIVMVNVLRTRRRLMGIMWLSLGVGVILSCMAIGMYWRGELKAEGYRVQVDIGGMFGNPNDMAMHLVMMTPLTVALALAAKSRLMRVLYFAVTALFVAGNVVSFSRGGFLGLIVSSAILAWKLGRRQRLNVTIASIVAGGLFILLAPGNYGLRILSIFIPGLDPVGSSDQRKELLFRSIWVTIRNPWGIGIGNSPIMNDYNLQTHNSYTQVSSELGLLGLAAYLIFLVSPFRKLAAIERTEAAKEKRDWFYYLSIGLQASIAGYMVSSFFGSVAYNWYAYYLIAYAVAFRRIYRLENERRQRRGEEQARAEKSPALSGELQTA
jgi:O-antigen ligase